MVRRFFERPEWSEGTKAMRTRQTLESPRKLRPELEGWLRPCLSGDRPFVDVGCGIGGLLSAATQLGYEGVGVDSCMTVLVIAKRMIAAAGGRPVLACGYAESLPLRPASVSAVTMYDVIEHVVDPDRAIGEADRVIRPGGHLAISTPNRFSMAAEPHVFLWGVGWLPRRLQRSYVQWRGRAYDGVRLLSTGEMSRMLGSHEDLRYELRVPPVPDDEIRHFGPRRAALARLYNRVATIKISRGILLRVGPFFQVMARRSPNLPAVAPHQER
jgi:SAM-dependent methyltransferase